MATNLLTDDQVRTLTDTLKNSITSSISSGFDRVNAGKGKDKGKKIEIEINFLFRWIEITLWSYIIKSIFKFTIKYALQRSFN